MVNLFNFRYSNRCAVVYHCSFNLHFTNNVEHLLICLFAICISSSVKCLFRSFNHILLGCLFSFYCILRVLFIFLIQILYQIDDLHNFLPVCGLSFHFLNNAFQRAEIFLMKSNLFFSLSWIIVWYDN